jgi:hypothetical protein
MSSGEAEDYTTIGPGSGEKKMISKSFWGSCVDAKYG